jgi:hypothetical protein
MLIFPFKGIPRAGAETTAWHTAETQVRQQLHGQMLLHRRQQQQQAEEVGEETRQDQQQPAIISDTLLIISAAGLSPAAIFCCINRKF